MSLIIKRRKVSVVNPHGPKATRKRHAKATRPKRRNPGQLLLIGPVNPHRSTKPVKKARRVKKQRKAHAHHTIAKKATNPTRRRRNPSRIVKVKAIRRRRNPSRTRAAGSVSISNPISLLKLGSSVAGGVVLSRQLPQLALGANNNGLIGYGANLAVALISAWAGAKFIGREIGYGLLAGGMGYTVSRVLTEKVSPLGQYLSISGLSGVGDPAAATLGSIQNDPYYIPETRNDDGSLYVSSALQPPVALPAPAAAPALAGVDRWAR